MPNESELDRKLRHIKERIEYHEKRNAEHIEKYSITKQKKSYAIGVCLFGALASYGYLFNFKLFISISSVLSFIMFIGGLIAWRQYYKESTEPNDSWLLAIKARKELEELIATEEAAACDRANDENN